MKKLITLFECFVGCILLAGCANDLQFQVVDSSSGAPVSGVEIKRRKVTSFSYFHRTLREREVGLTGTNGIVDVPEMSSKDVITFEARGYHDSAAGLHEHDKVRINWAYPSRMESWYTPRQIITNRNGVVVIPLLPLTTSE